MPNQNIIIPSEKNRIDSNPKHDGSGIMIKVNSGIMDHQHSHTLEGRFLELSVETIQGMVHE